jgi:hypothetical protein
MRWLRFSFYSGWNYLFGKPEPQFENNCLRKFVDYDFILL